MDSAKAAIKEHLSRDGKHDTSVHENFNPAVTNEKVHDHHKHHTTTAVDREEHVDHYHTTVQPVHDTKVLPETHHHNAAPVEHRKFEHGDDDEVQRRLQTEKAKFVDTSDKGETHHTHESAPVVGGVHTHHHIHESIQPVVQRQTIEPHVHHNVIPVHEHHHLAAQHHASSALPALSMEEFKKQGGALGGREQRSDFFEGEPQNYAKDSSNAAVENPKHEFRQTGHHDLHDSNKSHTGRDAAVGGAAGLAGAEAVHHHEKKHDTGLGSGKYDNTSSTNTGALGSSNTTSANTGSLGGNKYDTTSAPSGGLGSNTNTGSLSSNKYDSTSATSGGLGSNTNTGSLGSSTGTGTGTVGTDGKIGQSGSTGTSGTKASLLDRLNPMKDTDGDGKKGVFS